MKEYKTDEDRKRCPIATGVLDYFPDALAAVAECSWAATWQHHPDEPMHWDRNKSPDEPNSLIRHFMDRGKLDSDGVRHSAKMAWRALALLQKEIEADLHGQEKEAGEKEAGQETPDAFDYTAGRNGKG